MNPVYDQPTSYNRENYYTQGSYATGKYNTGAEYYGFSPQSQDFYFDAGLDFSTILQFPFVSTLDGLVILTAISRYFDANKYAEFTQQRLTSSNVGLTLTAAQISGLPKNVDLVYTLRLRSGTNDFEAYRGRILINT